MQRLHHCVNVVPVIAKSDTFTIEERDSFKKRVSEWVDNKCKKTHTEFNQSMLNDLALYFRHRIKSLVHPGSPEYNHSDRQSCCHRLKSFYEDSYTCVSKGIVGKLKVDTNRECGQIKVIQPSIHFWPASCGLHKNF